MAPTTGRLTHLGRLGAAGLAAGLVARTAATVAGHRLAERPGWQLVNYRGRPVRLVAGPALTAGVLAGALVGELTGRRQPCRPAGTTGRTGLLGASACAALGAAALGRADDLARDEPKGLRGHLGALSHGRVTAGAVKLAGLPLLGLPVAAARGGRGARLVRDALLVAAAADVANLLDVRPGRTLKACVATGTPLLGRAGWLAAPLLGAAAALLPADLGEREALGDCGANAAGAILGSALVAALTPGARDRWLAAAAGLVLVSEAVPLTRLIDAVGPLRRLDRWGRAGPGRIRPGQARRVTVNSRGRAGRLPG